MDARRRISGAGKELNAMYRIDLPDLSDAFKACWQAAGRPSRSGADMPCWCASMGLSVGRFTPEPYRVPGAKSSGVFPWKAPADRVRLGHFYRARAT